MTLIHDPCQSSKGIRITKRSRQHRRRNKSPSTSWKAKAAKATTSSNQTQLSGEDLLDSRSPRENSMPRSTGTTKQPRPHDISPTRASFSLAKTTSQSVNRRRRRALAVDTRFLEALKNSTLPESIIHNIQSLLQKASLRGLAPSVVVMSQLQKERKGPSCIRVHSYSLDKALENIINLEPLYIPTQSLETKIPEKLEAANESAVVLRLPELLSAKSSWKLFGDFVLSALQSSVVQETPPCNNLTIITNDISFLSDTRATAHKDGLNYFWERCRPFFLEDKLNSIEIVVLWTNAEMIHTKDGAATCDMSAEEKVEKNAEDHQDEDMKFRSHRQAAVADFVSTLNLQFRQKSEEEFRANRSSIQFDVTQHIQPITMSLSIAENSALGMMTLLREWSRKEVPGPKGVTLHFPSTNDSSGRHKLRLDASYKTIPFALDSDLTLGLQNDLKLIAQSKLEVIKSVPIESIDASLLYGVPIRVRSGLQADMESHQAMVQIVQSLFRQLSKKERALIITSSPQPSTESTTNIAGLFHQSEHQIFVLMSEEIPMLLRRSVPPSTGILLRLASPDHFVEEVGVLDTILAVSENDMNILSEPMEHTLDSLTYSHANIGLNPMYISVLQARQAHSADLPTNDSNIPSDTRNDNIKIDSEDKWNDNSGVGSSEAAFNAAQELVSSEDVPLLPAAYQPPSRKQPSYSSELEDDDDSGLELPATTKPIPLVLNRSQFPRSRTGEGTVGEEVEWTDGEDSFQMGDSLDSEHCNGANEHSAGVFEYSD